MPFLPVEDPDNLLPKTSASLVIPLRNVLRTITYYHDCRDRKKIGACCLVSHFFVLLLFFNDEAFNLSTKSCFLSLLVSTFAGGLCNQSNRHY